MGGIFTRRGVLRNFIVGTAGVTALAKTAHGRPAAKSAAASGQPAGTCMLTPQAMAGPYYFDPDLVRSDIGAGREGKPLRLVLRLLDVGTCKPLDGVRVDVWHCDARGVYSGYANQGDDRATTAEGETYLRGTQFTGNDGTVVFETIYPGWYPGRTPHIHLKAFLDDRTLVTTQVYFPDETSENVYRHGVYARRGSADTTNGTDFLFRSARREGGGIVLATEDANGRVVGTLDISVDRSGRQASGWSIFRLLGG